jgi:hypothetical protein
LVGWHAGAVSLSPGDIILAHLACPMNDIIFVSGVFSLSLYRHYLNVIVAKCCHLVYYAEDHGLKIVARNLFVAMGIQSMDKEIQSSTKI